jgi:cytochrome c553
MPRLAGLSAEYLARQLRAFKNSERPNIVMSQFSIERDLSEAEIRDISVYLSKIDLHKNTPLASDSLLSNDQFPLDKRMIYVKEDLANALKGKYIYRKLCKNCHGIKAGGGKRAPQLAGQYPNYIIGQIGDFRDAKRPHPVINKNISKLTETDLHNLLAYLAELND